jgi:predicted nucleic acid-binding protein
MILVDTSVWVDHLAHRDAALSVELNAGQVLIHPFVVGELACGNLRNRQEVLTLLQRLPQAQKATDAEVLAFVEGRKLTRTRRADSPAESSRVGFIVA